MIVVCRDCDTSFNLNDGVIKPSGTKVRCSKCKNVFMVFPPIDAISAKEAQNKNIFDKTVELSVEDKNFDFSGFEELDREKEPPKDESLPEAGKEDISDPGKFDFADLDKGKESPALESDGAGKEEPALSDDDFDLSEFDKIFEDEIPATGDSAAAKNGEAQSAEAEDMDFSDLEKMLATDPGEKISGVKPDEMEPVDKGELDLSDIESIIDNLEEESVDGKAAEPEELTFDIEPAQDEIVSRIEDEEELDFSDLEKMLDTDEVQKYGKEKEPELKLDMEAVPPATIEGDESEDIDLAELDKLLISLEKEESEAAPEKEPEALDLDFSDFDTVLEAETADAEKDGDKEQELELKLDSGPEIAASPEGKPDDLDLDFSEVEKMLEMEEKAELPEQKVTEETLELEHLEEEPPEKVQEPAAWADTIVTDKDGLFPSGKESEDEAIPQLEEYTIDKFQSTVEMSGTASAVDSSAALEEEKREPEKEIQPVKTARPSGKFLSIVGIILIAIAAVGAFAVYNPFGIEIPFVGDLTGAKGDEKGTLKITPMDETIKGDFVPARGGNIFVITGTVRNNYKHPRSYISVTGKLFKKGKIPLKSETVFCGNLIPPNDLGTADPALMKKRLQNRFGDNKSNAKVQPGGMVQFMMIFENVTDELDEYSVEAAGSVKE